MKLDLEDDRYIVFLKKDNIKDVDFRIKKQVEECFRNIFKKIRKRLDKDINGFFNITVYLNDSFGAILIIEKEELEYYDYFKNQIDMQINIEYDSIILLEFDDIFNISVNLDNVYMYNNKFYIKYVEDIKKLEFSRIIYGKEAENVIEKGIILYNVCDL